MRSGEAADQADLHGLGARAQSSGEAEGSCQSEYCQMPEL
jgi:hypothetical protein